jgi:hypothetical protein
LNGQSVGDMLRPEQAIIAILTELFAWGRAKYVATERWSLPKQDALASFHGFGRAEFPISVWLGVQGTRMQF